MTWTEELFALIANLRLNCRVAWDLTDSDPKWEWKITVYVDRASGRQIGAIDSWREEHLGRSVEYDAGRGFRLIQRLPRDPKDEMVP